MKGVEGPGGRGRVPSGCKVGGVLRKRGVQRRRLREGGKRRERRGRRERGEHWGGYRGTYNLSLSAPVGLVHILLPKKNDY